MGNEKSYEMDKGIAGRVKQYMILFTALFLILLWGEEIYKLLIKSINGNKDQAELSIKIITSIIAIITAGSAMLLNIGRDIKFHYFIDDKLFRVRNKTCDIIINEIIKAGRKVGAQNVNSMIGEKEKVMHLFYHFINEQNVLRDISFTYWENYFVNIYAMFLGLIFFLGSTVYLCIRMKLDYLVFIPCIYLLIVFLIGLSTFLSLVKRIYALPVQQIEEIRTSKAMELNDEISSRFGSAIQNGVER